MTRDREGNIIFDKLMYNVHEVAELFGVSEPALGQWRSRGYGPRFKKVGAKVFYSSNSLRDFLSEDQQMVS